MEDLSGSEKLFQVIAAIKVIAIPGNDPPLEQFHTDSGNVLSLVYVCPCPVRKRAQSVWNYPTRTLSHGYWCCMVTCV